MTDSACWIEVEDIDAKVDVVQGADFGKPPPTFKRFHDMPWIPTSAYLWICVVRDWALSQGLPIGEGSWGLEIVVQLTRAQLHAFLNSLRNPADWNDLRAEIDAAGDRVFRLVADEL